MKTIDKYILKEMLIPFAVGFLSVLVLLIGNIVYNNISLIVSKIQYWPLVLYYILLQTSNYILLALPAGALFGCSLAISRLARDSEITSIRMAGVKITRIFIPIFVFGALISIVSYVFQENITVKAEKKSVEILKKLWLTPGLPPIQPNVFFQVEDYYFYVKSVHKSADVFILNDIMIYELPRGAGFPTITTAKSATEKNQVWVLKNGYTYKISNEGFPELVTKFETLKMDIKAAIEDYILTEEKSPKSMTAFELGNQIKRLSQRGQDTQSLRLEYGFKLAMPLGSFILMFCIAPLSYKFGKSGGFTGVLLAIIIYFFYWNVIWFSRVLGETGGIPASIAGWSEIIIFGIIGAVFIYRAE